MAEPTIDQRTPTIGLRFSSQDELNLNWWKLDDTIARAFQPDSPLQPPPGGFDQSALGPGSVTSDTIYPGETIRSFSPGMPTTERLLHATDPMFTLASILLGNARGGPVLLAGCLPILVAGSSTSQQSFTLAVQAVIYGTIVSLVQLDTVVLAQANYHIFIPLSAIAIPSGVANSNVLLQAQKQSGSDATMTI